jgi:hypothetical protein
MSKPKTPPDIPIDPKSESLDELAPQITKVLCSRGAGASRAKKLKVSGAICDLFVRQGRLLCDVSTGQDSPCVISDVGEVLMLTDSLTVQVILSRAGLNATESMYKWLLADLQTEGVKRGIRVNLRRYAHQTADAIYFSCGPTKIIKSTDSGLQCVENGADGVLFASTHTYPQWKIAPPVSPVDVALFSPNLEAPPECPGYTDEFQTRLLHDWLVAAGAGVRPLPALLPNGQMGTGKTLTQSAVAKLFKGPEADVSTAPASLRDMQVSLCSSPLAAFDNLDGEVEPWFPDLFCTAVTGGTVEIRKLYTGNELETRALTAAICISARTPRFAERSDVQERILPIFFGERRDSERKDDSILLSEVVQKRDGLMSWAARTAAVLLGDGDRGGYPGRFQTFGRLVCRLDPFNGEECLHEAYRAARVAVSDHDPMIQAILEYGKPLKGTSKEIIQILENNGFQIPYQGGGKRVAMLLREHRNLYRLMSKREGVGVVFTISPKADHVLNDGNVPDRNSLSKQEKENNKTGEVTDTTLSSFATRTYVGGD